MSIFTEETKTGDIVVQLPRASSILKAYRIDFCCGGNRPIGEVLSEKNLDEQKVLDQLNSLYEEVKSTGDSFVRWEEVSSEDLINHVVATHHEYLREQMPEISAYVTKILRVHGANHPELERVYQYYHEVKQELDEHIDEEERDVFPLVLAVEKGADEEQKNRLKQMVLDMEDEHQKAGRLLELMREITLDYDLPADACATYQLTFKKLEELESDLFQHIHLENNILFPRFLD